MSRHSLEILEARIAPANATVTDAAGLIAAINDANDHSGLDTIVIKSSITLDATHLLPAITDDLIIKGQSAKKITIDGSDLVQIFDLEQHNAGTAGSPNLVGIDVTISGLTLTRGRAESGGAIRIDDGGGHVRIVKSVISHSHVEGASNVPYSAGEDAAGGGVFIAQGAVTLFKTTITGNTATGGDGVAGESGTDGYYDAGDASLANGAPGHPGYVGGRAVGGGIANEGGTLIVQSSTISGNAVTSGHGGDGGRGGDAYDVPTSPYGYNGGLGGQGGAGGLASGGGIFSAGTLVIQKSTVSGNTATSAAGGAGGHGGDATPGQNGLAHAGIGGNGGAGGSPFGAGLGLASDSSALIEKKSVLSGNTGKGASGGAAGANGAGNVVYYNGKYDGLAGLALGGGVGTLEQGANAIFRDLTITGNKADRGGGAYLGASTQVLLRATISGNTAADGGGIAGAFSLVDSTVRDNTASHDGGGFFAGVETLGNGTSASIQSSVLHGNTAGHDGGGGQVLGTLEVTGSKLSGNMAGHNGGGVDVYGYEYSATYPVPSLSFTRSTVSGNTAAQDGGGLFAFKGNVRLTQSTLDKNSATHDGGGIAVTAYGTIYGYLEVYQSTISRNHAVDGAGISAFEEAQGVIDESTIALNVATGNGGALSLTQSARFLLKSSTVAFNTAAGGGGTFLDVTETLGVVSSIIAKNTAGTGPDAGGAGSLGLRFSLLGSDSGAVIADPADLTFLKNLDPHLKKLKQNGGPTETILLAKQSAAIDTGEFLDELTDQRGQTRFRGAGADMGALEVG